MVLSSRTFAIRLLSNIAVGIIATGTIVYINIRPILAVAAGVLITIVLYFANIPRGGNFSIDPIEESGENVYYRDSDFGSPGGTEKYYVWVTFDFRSIFPLEIRDIVMRYVSGGAEGPKEVTVNGENKSIGKNYRLENRIHLEPRKSVEIHIDQEYICPYAHSTDYGEVTIIFKLNSNAWRRFKRLKIEGELEPGGGFSIKSKTVTDGFAQRIVTYSQKTLHRIIEKGTRSLDNIVDTLESYTGR